MQASGGTDALPFKPEQGLRLLESRLQAVKRPYAHSSEKIGCLRHRRRQGRRRSLDRRAVDDHHRHGGHRVTINQVMDLARAGSELVRVTVNTNKAAEAVPTIVKSLEEFGVRVPIIGDFHYNGHILLKQYPECARLLAKYRINPGNVNIGRKHDDNFRTMIEVAVEHQKPVRIGVNWGSLDQALLTKLMDENAGRPDPKDAAEVTREAIVLSALNSAEAAERYGLRHDQIILSAKVSNVQDLVTVYRDLAARCDYPLHLGLTEAGMGNKGIVASTAGLAILLQEGIGDTIRVSLTPQPRGDRTRKCAFASRFCSHSTSAASNLR